MSNKLDTRAIGLDVGLSFTNWVTGADNLHYGLWDGLEANAGNLHAAQAAYTTKLFKLLPKGKLRILDIGGGAGETARKLLALGHSVDIVVPSEFLAKRCRENAPEANVHECMFEDLETDGAFDLCLFSESFQYIPMNVALEKSMSLLTDNGHIIVADCFRSETFEDHIIDAKVGGGHPVLEFRQLLTQLPLLTLSEEDITDSVSQSVDIEQGLFNVFGLAITRIDAELSLKKPKTRWILHRIICLFFNKRKRYRLNQRLNEQTRNAANFRDYNRYLMVKLEPE